MLPAYAIIDVIIAQFWQIDCQGIFKIYSTQILLQQESQDCEDLCDACNSEYRLPCDIRGFSISVITED